MSDVTVTALSGAQPEPQVSQPRGETNAAAVEWHVPSADECGDEEDAVVPEGDPKPSVRLAPPSRPSACHVVLRSAAPDSSPPPGALTGRAHQRYDGDQRLLCGCVPFRVDLYPEAAVTSAAASEQKGDASSSTSSSSTSPPPLSGAVLRVLLVGSRKGDLIFAKGGWEQFESRPACAARELLEEGGVEGAILSELESPVEFASKKTRGRSSRFYPFLLQVTASHERWAEQGARRRRWLRLEEVGPALKREETKRVWAMAVQELTRLGFLDAEGRAVYKEPPSLEQQLTRFKELEMQAEAQITKSCGTVATAEGKCTTVAAGCKDALPRATEPAAAAAAIAAPSVAGAMP
jgi:diphosphoinositol-polyphosphate diphosphatase